MIEWDRVDIIEIDLIEFTLTLKTRQGFLLAKSKYDTKDEVMENSEKCYRNMNKAKSQKE